MEEGNDLPYVEESFFKNVVDNYQLKLSPTHVIAYQSYLIIFRYTLT